jgi:hypothetical protein
MRVLGMLVAATTAAWVPGVTAQETPRPRPAPTTCADRAKAYADKVGANRDLSSADEWDKLGRDCLERSSYAAGVDTYRRGLAYHAELETRLANLAAVYSESGRHELAYCLKPKDKALKKAWEHTKRTSRLCAETDRKGFLFVPPDLR